MGNFKIHSKFKPMGDQPVAIESLVSGLNKNEKFQTLLGVTGSGKTYTMANIIEKVQKPTIVLAHNKTLAAQLCSEFKEFFPNNIVEYFVSYYDYYQPEAYVPQTDTFIEKDASINDEIDKLRHSATSALFERRDVIIVASVSCIYGLGNPDEYKKLTISLRVGMEKERDEIIKRLIEIQYERNDIDFARGTFRVRGDSLDIIPASSSTKGIRIEFFGDEIDRIREFDVLTGKILGEREHVAIFPASHFAASQETLNKAIREIENFPKEGINFKDITTLMQDGETFKYTIDAFINELKDKNVDVIVGPEARGFLMGTPVAYGLGVGFVPVRKPGKLPSETISYSYGLEYGSDTLQIHKDAIKPGQRVAIVDDLLATGGTMEAAAKLIEQLGGEVVSMQFLIELEDLKGREKLSQYEVNSLIKY